MTMTICTAGVGATTATVVFANHTSGASTSVNFTAPAGTKLVGNCAEWIVEAPTVGGAQSTIPDYGEVFFSVLHGELIERWNGEWRDGEYDQPGLRNDDAGDREHCFADRDSEYLYRAGCVKDPDLLWPGELRLFRPFFT